MPKKQAFTLIELLIVVAIISILATIAVPNFLEAQTRAKISRAKADMRSVAFALEMFLLDNNRYPPDRYFYTIVQSPPMDAATADLTLWLHVLTTPMAYITSIPDSPFTNRSYNDAFAGTPAAKFYLYEGQDWKEGALQIPLPEPIASKRSNGGSMWSLATVGPDQVSNFPEWYIFGQDVGDSIINNDAHMHGALYDPTNGSLSSGDVIRFGP